MKSPTVEVGRIILLPLLHMGLTSSCCSPCGIAVHRPTAVREISMGGGQPCWTMLWLASPDGGNDDRPRTRARRGAHDGKGQRRPQNQQLFLPLILSQIHSTFGARGNGLSAIQCPALRYSRPMIGDRPYWIRCGGGRGDRGDEGHRRNFDHPVCALLDSRLTNTLPRPAPSPRANEWSVLRVPLGHLSPFGARPPTASNRYSSSLSECDQCVPEAPGGRRRGAFRKGGRLSPTGKRGTDSLNPVPGSTMRRG